MAAGNGSLNFNSRIILVCEAIKATYICNYILSLSPTKTSFVSFFFFFLLSFFSFFFFSFFLFLLCFVLFFVERQTDRQKQTER